MKNRAEASTDGRKDGLNKEETSQWWKSTTGCKISQN